MPLVSGPNDLLPQFLPLLLIVILGLIAGVHQENVRVIFGVFVSGNHISERYVFAKEVFQGLCLWVRIFNI